MGDGPGSAATPRAVLVAEWQVKDVKVEGNTATVKLDITNANLESAMTAARTELSNMGQEELMQLSQSSDSNALAKRLMEAIYKHLDESTDLVTTSVELKMNKVNGNWTADDKSLDDFVQAVFGVGKLFGSDASDSQ